ncbi:MAG TPA: ferredoxin [Chthoniobacteraceae bacterium]|nr:ferredoxin [Chthoniobacteraceae bacterium]
MQHEPAFGGRERGGNFVGHSLVSIPATARLVKWIAARGLCPKKKLQRTAPLLIWPLPNLWPNSPTNILRTSRGNFTWTISASIDLCRETAPANFTRNDDGGHSYVYKQPENDDEAKLCKEAMEGCPVEAIGSDGAA